eukprot:976232-Alexandrium_andersonii.AAC.1
MEGPGTPLPAVCPGPRPSCGAPPPAVRVPRPLRSAAVALPGVVTSPEAEAWGCRLAIELALEAPVGQAG